MILKNWGSSELMGEASEDLSRCAALSKFGIHEDMDTDLTARRIRADDDFDVS